MNKDRRRREEEDKEKDQRDWILAGRDLPAKQWAVYRMVRYRGPFLELCGDFFCPLT